MIQDLSAMAPFMKLVVSSVTARQATKHLENVCNSFVVV